jgi:hypothetical protein
MAKIIEFNVKVKESNDFLEEKKDNILEIVETAKTLRKLILIDILDLLKGQKSFDLCAYEVSGIADKPEILVLSNCDDEFVTKNVWFNEMEMNWMSRIYKIERKGNMLFGYWSHNANENNVIPFNELKIEELLKIYYRMFKIISCPETFEVEKKEFLFEMSD